MGSIGLMAFGLVVWLLVPLSTPGGLFAATVAWLVVSVFSWRVRRKLRDVH